jgi:subtilase family serine protease
MVDLPIGYPIASMNLRLPMCLPTNESWQKLTKNIKMVGNAALNINHPSRLISFPSINDVSIG